MKIGSFMTRHANMQHVTMDSMSPPPLHPPDLQPDAKAASFLGEVDNREATTAVSASGRPTSHN